MANKIKLLMDVPVEDKHGMKVNRELEVIRPDPRGYWVMGDAGEEVLIQRHECVVIEESFI